MKILGAIIGDIVGSTREKNNVKSENFSLLEAESRFTDDTVMTLAVAEWLMTDPLHSSEVLVECMQRLGRKYPNAGYGGMFYDWLHTDNPQPYNSFGNGSAMRVSPVGLYASSLDEALELARITASVSHNHPEGIKGAQAIAACVYLKKAGKDKGYIKGYIEGTFGYDLSLDLRKLRSSYTFDVTCQGSVPIAIMAFLQGADGVGSLCLAVSMGGDSDTIAAMTCSIVAAEKPGALKEYGCLYPGLENRCYCRLTPDLREINDRFVAFVSRPLYQSYLIDSGDVLFAGEYPGDKDGIKAEEKIRHMYHFGVRHFVDFTEEGELAPYNHLLPEDVTYTRFSIRDCGVPADTEDLRALLHRIEELKEMGGYIYMHCWGGVGRTGTVVACRIALDYDTPELDKVLESLRDRFAQMPKAAGRVTPETAEQVDFIARFISEQNARWEEYTRRLRDSIRGSLVAGAAGDALGYEVEFMSRNAILLRYGGNGITRFELHGGKALVSDDTQMTLYTANGLMNICGPGSELLYQITHAYIDWYYTQTTPGKIKRKSCWISSIPELHARRAPGGTCISSLDTIIRGGDPCNNSKGCGCIMRVAPIALYASAWRIGDREVYVARLAADAAEVTHQHPLGFLPAALLAVLIYKVVGKSPEYVKCNICSIVSDTLNVLDTAYDGKYEVDRQLLRELTGKAMRLAHSDIPVPDAISMLGEGWTGEEAWAIALYCAVRNIDSVEDAIVAAVNHDGDSDSTGAICGNIMGAIYGYEHLEQCNLFCPQGYRLDETLELSDVILALADDLWYKTTGIQRNSSDEQLKKRWHERYSKLEPSGIGDKKQSPVYDRKFTPERISELKENEIFVFGSNLRGAHGGGAARLAYERFGAVWGKGVGLQGRSYAIPTMQGGVETIKPYVDEFIGFAKKNKGLLFYVTRIGCGIAGFSASDIAPLFVEAIGVENIILPEDFVTAANV